MESVARRWRRLFRHEVYVGNPTLQDTWERMSVREVSDDYAPFEWGRLLPTRGGWRLMLFRWLALVDPGDPDGYYQPSIWLEWAPAGEDELGKRPGSYLLLYLTLLPAYGQLRITLAANWWAIRHRGPVTAHWKRFHR